MYRALIFDLDGTLADTLGDLQLAMNEMLRSFGWPERSRGELLRFINRGARSFVADSMPAGSWRTKEDEIVDRALTAYGEAYRSRPIVLTKPFPGICEALASLKEKKVRLAVLSNKQDDLVRMIVDTLFPGIFDAVSGQRDLPVKPDPSAALQLADKLGVPPRECVFCGDSDIDMKTARNAGMLSLGVLWGYRDRDCLVSAGAEHLLSSPDDIPSFWDTLPDA